MMFRFGNTITAAVFGLAVAAIAWSAAGAQNQSTQPEYYVVRGVAQNDVLNVRRDPSGASDIVGELAPGAGPVEVLFEQGNWGYIISGEANGYVSMNFLQQVMMPRIGQTGLPVGSFCAGNEPFWSLELSSDSLTLSDFSVGDGQDQTFDLVEGDGVGNTGTYQNYLRAQGAGQSLVAFTTNRICSDGMSDRDYPREIHFLIYGAAPTKSYVGCCRVQTFAP